MTYLALTPVVLLLLSLALLTLHEARTDGRGSQRPPASHPRDPRFLPPSARR